MAGRKYAQKNLLHSSEFKATISHVKATFPQFSWVLIGLAVSHHANPPVTVDSDILFDNHDWPVKEDELRGWMTGWRHRLLWFMTGLRGFPRTGHAFTRKGFGTLDVLFTGKDKFLRSVVKNPEMAKLSGLSIPVITPENLIVMKVLAGREKDEEDVRSIQEALGDSLDNHYINKMIEKLS